VDPDPAGYFHCTTSQWVTAYGCQVWLNCWDPVVDIPTSPGDDHSISQTWLQNYQASTTHSVEAGLTVDLSLNGDAASHLFIYYTTNDYAGDGDNIGGYNRIQLGWVQVHPTIFPGILAVQSSAPGATPVELGLKFQLHQGNWWLAINNAQTWTWLGYYPGTLFPGGLADHAEWVSFGGEVFSALSNPCATTDQMGSGRQADGGWSYAAYQRNLQYQAAASGTMADFDGNAESDTAASGCPAGAYTIEVFMQSGSSWASYQYFGGPSSGWEPLGGQPASPVQALSWAPGRLDLFARGTDNAVWHKWWSGTAWGPSSTTWETLGGQTSGGVAGAAWAPGRLDVFVRGTDNAVWHKDWDGSGWRPSMANWQSLGGTVTSDPVAVAWAPDRLDVFARAADGGVAHRCWNGTAWQPASGPWESLGGAIIGTVMAVARAANRLDLFVHGTDNAVWYKSWDGTSWRPSSTLWTSLGGHTVGAVAAVAAGPNRLHVFVRGTDNAVWHKWWDGAAWQPSLTGWQSLGGVAADDPTAVSSGPNRIDVFVRGTDNAVWHKWWDGATWQPSSTAWESVGGSVTARPSAVAPTSGRLDVFVRGTDNAAWHRGWSENSLPA
jgi:hypothetical protein